MPRSLAATAGRGLSVSAVRRRRSDVTRAQDGMTGHGSGLRREATMPERRRAGLMVGGMAGGVLVAATVYFGFFTGRREASPAPAVSPSSSSDGSLPAQGLRNSDPAAL